jgi:L-lactate dehydrogenase complex protein LldG
MDAKQEILGRIRKGLKAHKVLKPFPLIENDTSNAFQDPSKEIVTHFAENFIQLGGQFAYCANENECISLILELATERDWKKVFVKDTLLLAFLRNENFSFLKTGNPSTDLDASITLCKSVVARLGSVILSSDADYGRSLPVYTPVHIAIVYANQIVWDIKDAMSEFQNTINLPSQITLTTGPSRTADIEKTLVVGVHGPKEVFVFFIDKPAPNF